MSEPIRPGSGSGSGGLGRAQDIRSSSAARSTIQIHGPWGPPVTLAQGSALQIGRQPKNDLILEGPTVSRHHATIVWSPDKARPTIEDLASANGTSIDGKAIKAGDACLLPDGAIVEIGEHRIGVGRPVPGGPAAKAKTGSTPPKTARPETTIAANPKGGSPSEATARPSGLTSRPTERLQRQPAPDSRHDGIGYVSFGNKRPGKP
jgi:pSer/pThr/pTyr-binding forkhead associated (FHA) protein